MHERRYNRAIEGLRDPQRLARLEVERVVVSSIENLQGLQTVLDIGVGSGVFAEAFVARGLAASGVDANPEMLPVARQYVPSGMFKEGTAENLPFQDKSFDLAFMGLVMHETDDKLAALKETLRVSKKRLAILEWPYEEQSFGPPLAHRVTAELIADLATQVGFIKVDHIRLQNLILYRCEIV